MGREAQLYGEGEIMAKWINAKDKLPNEGEEVLFWLDVRKKAFYWMAERSRQKRRCLFHHEEQ